MANVRPGPQLYAVRMASTRTLSPKHIVMATGVSGIPNMPDP